MTLVRFLPVLTLVSLAFLHSSFHALPVNALAVERGHIGRDISHAHAEIAKRGSSKKCRPRPTSASPTPTANTPNPDYQRPSAPSSSSSSHAAQPTVPASSSPASSVNSKIMYAWSNLQQPSITNFLNGETRFIYNWHLTTYTDFEISSIKNLEFVPTAHSRDDVYQALDILKPGYARYAKFVNEPEIGSQANMQPEEAHALWMKYFEPLKGRGYQLIAPAVTGAGLEWIAKFLSLCNGGCSIYAADYHYYGIDTGDFQTAVNAFHKTVNNLPVWITEIGCHDYSGHNKPCTQGVFDAFFPGVMSYAESTSWIEQIAWFGMFTSSEMPMGVEVANSMITCPTNDNKQCKPNSLGYQFINYH